jgi:hypothetical protein
MSPISARPKLPGHRSILPRGIQGTLIVLTICQGTRTQEKGCFINLGQINPVFEGARPIYTGDFNEFVDKQLPKANFISRTFFAGLLALEQDRDLGSHVLANLLNQQPPTKPGRSQATDNTVNDLTGISTNTDVRHQAKRLTRTPKAAISSRTSTRSSPLLLQPNQKSTTQS